MKALSTILAYFGLVLMLAAAIPALQSTRAFLRSPAEFGQVPGHWEGLGLIIMYGFYPAALGALLALIGGIVSRPRYLWISLISISVIYILAFLGLYIYLFRTASQPDANPLLASIIIMSPGIACIIAGILIRTMKKRNRPAVV